MEAEIKSFIFKQDQFYPIQIFGHKSKSVPGLQIHGPTSFANNLKNKIVYLCKVNQIKIPQGKYQICLDLNYLEKGKFNLLELECLELPILILFLFLSENLLISKLSQCFAFGEFNIQGKLTFNTYAYFKNNLNYIIENDLVFLSPYSLNDKSIKNIDLGELLTIVNPLIPDQRDFILN